MSSIWASDEQGWRLLSPVGFPDEQALHGLIEEAPELLPLSGSPQLVVVGREIPLGGGFGDLLAIEPSGRLVLVEVKLAKNADARRAVVAQILAYAAFLRGTDAERLEREILWSKLREQDHSSLASLVESEDQEGSFNLDAFGSGLAESLDTGRFRLVLVLDDAPPELVRLVGYLESIAPELVIDLITVSAYEVNGSRVLVPQRIEPERLTQESKPPQSTTASTGHLIPPEEFAAGIGEAPAKHQPILSRMYEWAKELESEGSIRLLAYRGSTGRTTLLPYVPDDEAGLVTVWNDNGFSLSFWRSVFLRRAPKSIERVEELIAPAPLGQGNTVKVVSEELLEALTSAYREAAGQTS